MTTLEEDKKSISGTKKLLLDTALKLFAEKGYSKTTMRDIAKNSGLSLGASYHYFRSKDDIVLAFYETTAEEAKKEVPVLLERADKFQDRLKSIINFSIEQLKPYRHLVKILARNGADFSHPLSPFSTETKHLRQDAIGLIEQAVSCSDFKCSKVLESNISTILWMFQMGIILFWANDKSKDQINTVRLLDLSSSMVTSLLKLSKLAILSPVNKILASVSDIIISSFEEDLSKE